MKNRKLVAFVCACWLVSASLPSIAQQNSPQPSGQQNSQGSTPTSPGAGITSGTAPIETTLFAYRSLASDADAISREILALGMGGSKVVIGTAADVAAFAQWREIMAEAMLLDARAKKIHADFPTELPRNGPQPLPALTITETHSPAGNLAAGQKGIEIDLLVSNVSPSDKPSGLITVIDVLPAGWSVTGAVSANNWSCTTSMNQNSVSCTRTDPLAANSNYDPITITATAGPQTSSASNPVTETVTVIGGAFAPIALITVNFTVVAAKPPKKGLQPLVATAGGTSSPATTSGGSSGALGALTGAIPVFATLLNEAFAVTQTITSSQGAMTDAPLINMTAERLQQAGVTTLVPSVYIPNLLRNGALQDTYLWQELVELETDRAELWKDLAVASEELAKDTYITQHPTSYSATDLTTALEYSGRLQSLITSAQAVAASIDSFETTLFGGQATTQSQQQNQNQQTTQQTNPNSNPNNPSGINPAGQVSQTGNSTVPNGNGGTLPGGNGGNLTPGNQGANPSGNNTGNQNSQAVPQPTVATNVLPQILGADLLAQAIWASYPGQEPYDPTVLQQLDSVKFLIVHSLESGGSELTKSNFFFGSRILFSGGAVTTFSLYKASGDVLCSGFAYDYEGNVKPKNYDRTLRLSQLPAIVTTDFASCKQVGNKPEIKLRAGMTAADAFAAANVPYRAIAAKGNTYTYEFQDDEDTEIVVRDGIVIKVMKKPMKKSK